MSSVGCQGPISSRRNASTIWSRTALLAGGVEGECAATVSTVAEVQSGEFENRTVSFENVVVTEAESDFDGYSVFWIQDQGAGEWSGLYVFVRENTAAAITVQ